jgi:hypothetical protein
MDLRQPPRTTDVEIAKPMLVDLATELNKDDPIRFTQIGQKFVVDTIEFRVLLGFSYLQELLRNAGHFVACKMLSPIGGSVAFLPMAEQGMVRSCVNRKRALHNQIKHNRGDWSDDGDDYDKEEEDRLVQELLRIEEYLSSTTFNGKIKHIHNDYDRNRQSVCKAMRLAISYLEKHPDTTHVGQHLRNNIKFGARCRYFGDWAWIL